MPTSSDLTLFRIRGIRIGVDWSWFIVLFLIIVWLSDFFGGVIDAEQGALEPYVLAVAAALLFFGTILLHELGHAVVAIRDGIGIRDITLWLFGGVARMDRDTTSAGSEFRVAAGGPAVTLAIVVILCGVGIAVEGAEAFRDAMLYREGAETSGFLAMLAWLASINLLILVFNLIPAYPLDGGRIARAVAWRVTGNRTRATRFAARAGIGFSYVFIGIGLALALAGDLIGGAWLGFLGFILRQSARSAVLQSEVAGHLEGVRVGDVMDAEPVAIPEDASVERALDEYFHRYQWPWFPVVDATSRFRGLVQRGAADAVPLDRRATAIVSEIADLDSSGQLQIDASEPLEAVLSNQYLRALGALAATDSDGRLLGVLTAEQVASAMRTATPGG